MPSTPISAATTVPAWLLPITQLCDSAAPTGAFSHSLGLETYVIDGTVHDGPSFTSWLRAMIGGPLTYSDAMAVRLVFEADADAAQVVRVDRLLHAQTLPRQVRDATSAMGRRMVAIATEVAPSPALASYAEAVADRRCSGHPAVALAVVGHGLGAPLGLLMATHLQSVATSLTQNAVRLIPLGQNAGQRALAAVAYDISTAVTRTDTLPTHYFGATLPGLEIAQMRHERLRSRMYMS